MGRYVIAIGFIVAGALVPRLRRSSHPWAIALVRSYGVVPTGRDGTWTRADHLRAARGYALTTALLLTLALTIMGLADQWQNGTPLDIAFSYPGLVLFFLGIVAGWFAARSALRALRTGRAVGGADHSA